MPRHLVHLLARASRISGSRTPISLPQRAEKIKVGVLFSLTGTTAIIEESLNKATILAIEEINAAGGINGMKIVPVIEDRLPIRRPSPKRPRKLVAGDKCASVFGSYTSASRKAVLPVVEKQNNLYWYPTYYEGRECSKNVIYTGAVPNQQQDEFIPWLIKNFGKKFSMIGSNYIYPKEENNYCRKLLEKYGGEWSTRNTCRSAIPSSPRSSTSSVSGSRTSSSRQWSATPWWRCIANTRPPASTHAKMPMASLTTSENEIAAMGGEAAAGHFTSAPYFEVYKSPENEKFVAAYKKRWGADKVTHFVSEACYFQTYMFKQAVEKIGKGDITPNTIREAVKGVELIAPQGKVRLDGENLHTWLWPKIAQAKSNGQFEIIVEAKEWLRPDPYAAYPNQVCTEKGLVEKKV